MKDTGFMLAMLDVLANRDVSDEARDENGKWTDGGSAPGTPGRDASLVTRIGHWFKALIGGAITNADPGDPTADTTPPLITDANVAALSASAGFLDLPAPWREAIRRFKTKKLLPTTLTSEEISALPDEIRRRCFFSARVAEAEALDDIAKTVDKAITGAAGGQAAEARIAINQVMQDFGTPFKGGRANLIVTTQADMARGYARFRAGNTKLAVNMWPAYEFYRAEERIEPREWPARWADAGGEFFDGDSDYPEGRMVALKTDPIWTTISAFGQPYAPFDFNSGMDLREVSRSEAENLGLLTEDDELDPAPDPDFNEGVEVASAKGLSRTSRRPCWTRWGTATSSRMACWLCGTGTFPTRRGCRRAGLAAGSSRLGVRHHPASRNWRRQATSRPRPRTSARPKPTNLSSPMPSAGRSPATTTLSTFEPASSASKSKPSSAARIQRSPCTRTVWRGRKARPEKRS